MAKVYIKDGFKFRISRKRTHVTTYENMPLQSTEPIKEGKEKKRKPSIPSNYASFNYYNRMKQRRGAIKELCWNNFDLPYVVMLTLTYDTEGKDQQFTNLGESHKNFKKFIQRVNSHYDNFKYIATFSRQNNGNWHYHVMCNFEDTITNEAVSALWKMGFVYVAYIKDMGHFRNSINYLIQNMDESSDCIKGRRGYLYSKSLEHDIILKSWDNNNTDEYNEAYEKIVGSQNQILYETKNHLGIKGKRMDEETGNEIEVTIPDRELNETISNAGYESWDTVYTHVSSNADFSDKFKELLPATPSRKKLKRQEV